MEPYYDDGKGIQIYLADCRELLPTLEAGSVDLVLTDPPYGIHGAQGHVNRLRGKGNYTALFTDNTAYLAQVVVPIVHTLIERIHCVVLTPGSKNFALYPQPDSFGVFYQPASVGLQVFGNADAQPIFYYGKNASGKNMGVPCSYQLTESPETNGHPCVKPIRAWRRLLANVSRPRQTVLDPFMGSGTTLVAAKQLGRRCIGVEICEAYCEIAAKRLAQDVLPLQADEVKERESISQLPMLDAMALGTECRKVGV